MGIRDRRCRSHHPDGFRQRLRPRVVFRLGGGRSTHFGRECHVTLVAGHSGRFASGRSVLHGFGQSPSGGFGCVHDCDDQRGSHDAPWRVLNPNPHRRHHPPSDRHRRGSVVEEKEGTRKMTLKRGNPPDLDNVGDLFLRRFSPWNEQGRGPGDYWVRTPKENQKGSHGQSKQDSPQADGVYRDS